jgi:signal transduction histidine kinase
MTADEKAAPRQERWLTMLAAARDDVPAGASTAESSRMLAERWVSIIQAELVADRERIARDLHDHVIQRLFAVGLSLQGLSRVSDDEPARTRLDRAVGEIDEAIADLRSSIFDLRSVDDSRPGLRRRLADFARPAGPRITVRFHGPVDTVVEPRRAADGEAVVREALSNARRHARAQTVAVTVAATDSLTVTVADDGCGIGPDAARSGLKNLAQRAVSWGGTLTIDGESGTTLRWSVPL